MKTRVLSKTIRASTQAGGQLVVTSPIQRGHPGRHPDTVPAASAECQPPSGAFVVSPRIIVRMSTARWQVCPIYRDSMHLTPQHGNLKDWRTHRPHCLPDPTRSRSPSRTRTLPDTAEHAQGLRPGDTITVAAYLFGVDADSPRVVQVTCTLCGPEEGGYM